MLLDDEETDTYEFEPVAGHSSDLPDSGFQQSIRFVFVFLTETNSVSKVRLINNNLLKYGAVP